MECTDRPLSSDPVPIQFHISLCQATLSLSPGLIHAQQSLLPLSTIIQRSDFKDSFLSFEKAQVHTDPYCHACLLLQTGRLQGPVNSPGFNQKKYFPFRLWGTFSHYRNSSWKSIILEKQLKDKTIVLYSEATKCGTSQKSLCTHSSV